MKLKKLIKLGPQNNAFKYALGTKTVIFVWYSSGTNIMSLQA